jgi:hypothetical protein
MRYSDRIQSRGARRRRLVNLWFDPKEFEVVEFLQNALADDGAHLSRALVVRHALEQLHHAVAEGHRMGAMKRRARRSPTGGLMICLEALLGLREAPVDAAAA